MYEPSRLQPDPTYVEPLQTPPGGFAETPTVPWDPPTEQPFKGWSGLLGRFASITLLKRGKPKK